MKLVVGFSLVLGLASACSPDPRDEAARVAHAAQADSSAAGYDVATSTASSRGESGSSTARGDMGRRQGVRRSGTDSTGPAGVPPLVASVPLRPNHPGRQPAATVDTASGRLPGIVPALPHIPPIREADFLTYDRARRTVTFQLAAADDVPERVSFNGSTQGVRILTIPRGWTATINFVNRDPGFPHSAVVVSVRGVIPEELPPASFAGAETVRVREGLLDGSADDMTFVATREGAYLLACGVFGHAQRGQWISLVVSSEASVPSYR